MCAILERIGFWHFVDGNFALCSCACQLLMLLFTSASRPANVQSFTIDARIFDARGAHTSASAQLYLSNVYRAGKHV